MLCKAQLRRACQAPQQRQALIRALTRGLGPCLPSREWMMMTWGCHTPCLVPGAVPTGQHLLLLPDPTCRLPHPANDLLHSRNETSLSRHAWAVVDLDSTVQVSLAAWTVSDPARGPAGSHPVPSTRTLQHPGPRADLPAAWATAAHAGLQACSSKAQCGALAQGSSQQAASALAGSKYAIRFNTVEHGSAALWHDLC